MLRSNSEDKHKSNRAITHQTETKPQRPLVERLFHAPLRGTNFLTPMVLESKNLKSVFESRLRSCQGYTANRADQNTAA
ncbi:hypothetical protein CapIbe_014354 [Capra ibex]